MAALRVASIPKGLCHPAQGCSNNVRATLGRAHLKPQPKAGLHQPPFFLTNASAGARATTRQTRLNRLALDDAALLENLRTVQVDNNLPPDTVLQFIEEKIETQSGEQTIRFPNFSVEMETGTGKTYVYLRAVLGLFGDVARFFFEVCFNE